ncbi:MAG: VWA domain-containing protein, partial [Acidobacteria bacterium]|nr:VWA domain-containing protein [Acidobacteriota bacterium]
ALLALVAVGHAQQPTFKAGATLVRVDVTVVDRDGEPITELTADDFEVEEDGVLQTVEACKLVSADGLPIVGDDVSLAIRSQDHAAAEAARDEVRVFLIFWDEYHIGRFLGAIRAREEIAKFVSTAFGPTDLVALMDPLLPVDALEFTRDRLALAEKIHKLQGRLGVYMPSRSSAEDAMLERGDIARLRTEVTMSALKSAAVHLGSLREGRKSIVFVSEGFALRGDGPFMLEDVVRTANNNNTAIYTLDPRGLTGNVSDALRVLAVNTGAEAIVSSNTPAGALRQIVKDASAFYLLGYSSTRVPADDGRFHQIKVRVKRSKAEVRARRGYWAPSAADVERVQREASIAEVPADVSQALTELAVSRSDRALHIWIGTSRGTDGKPEVSVVWTPQSAEGAARAQGGALSVSAEAIDGKRTVEAPLDAGRVSLGAPPGAMQLHIVSRDASGDVFDEESRLVTVPEFPDARLTLSSPIVLRAQNFLEFRALGASPDPVPFAGHEFVRTDRLLIRFTVYGDSASNATVSARLMTRDQNTLVALPVAALPGRDSTYQIDFPLSSVARGDFLLAVEVANGDEHTRAVVPVRVTS